MVLSMGLNPVAMTLKDENWFLTYMLPMLVVLAVFFLFMLMNPSDRRR